MTRQAVSHLQALELAPQLLDGPELLELLDTQLNPGQQPHEPRYGELLAEPTLDAESGARERIGVAPRAVPHRGR